LFENTKIQPLIVLTEFVMDYTQTLQYKFKKTKAKICAIVQYKEQKRCREKMSYKNVLQKELRTGHWTSP